MSGMQWGLSAAALALGFGVAYALALTNHVTEDAIKYVKDSLVGGEALFHPHHLFYHGLMAGVVRIVDVGATQIDRAVETMQVANVLISVATVLAYFAICLRVGASVSRALTFSLLFGLSSAFFQFSSQVEVYNATALCSCLGILGMVTPKDDWRRRALVASGFFFAMSFHQVGIFLGVAILVGEALRLPRREAGSRLLATLVVPLVAIAASYGLVGLWLGLHSPGGIWEWVTLYSHTPYWGLGRVDVATLRNLTVGIGRALVDVSHLEDWLIVPAVLGLGTFIALHGRGFTKSSRGMSTLLACGSWLLVYGVFMAWWDAGNVESWILAGVPLYVIVAILGTTGAAALSRLRKRLAWLGLALCIGLMAVADVAYVRQDREPNWAREAALQLQEVAGSGDLVISVDSDKGAYYELYLLERGVRVEPINLALAMEARASGSASNFTSLLVGRLRDLVHEVHSEGGRCFVDTWVLEAEISRIRHMRDVDLAEFMELTQKAFTLRPLGSGLRSLVFEIIAVQPTVGLP